MLMLMFYIIGTTYDVEVQHADIGGWTFFVRSAKIRRRIHYGLCLFSFLSQDDHTHLMLRYSMAWADWRQVDRTRASLTVHSRKSGDSSTGCSFEVNEKSSDISDGILLMSASK